MTFSQIFSKHTKPISPAPTSLSRSGTLDEKTNCIVFDVYGTLFTSGSGEISTAQKKSQHVPGFEKLLSKFNISKSPDVLLEDFFKAIKNTHADLKQKGVDFPEVEIDRIWMRVIGNQDAEAVKALALEFELIVNPVYPMPHLKEVLSGCREHNVRMGIISNAQFYTPLMFRWFLGADLETLGFSPDLILFSYRYGYAKPSRFLFDVAVDKLKSIGIQTGSVLFVGNDMLNDIYPAKQAGFKTALFAGDSRSLRLRGDDPRCKNLSADIVITDLIQLLDYL